MVRLNLQMPLISLARDVQLVKAVHLLKTVHLAFHLLTTVHLDVHLAVHLAVQANQWQSNQLNSFFKSYR